jgi:hypothetical protein
MADVTTARARLAALEAQLQELDRGGMRNNVPGAQFSIIEAEVRLADSEFPGVMPPLVRESLSLGSMGNDVWFSRPGVRAYLVAATSRLRTLVPDEPIRSRPPATPGRVFLSHAESDKALAEHLKGMVEADGRHSVFMASRAGEIIPGEPWFKRILDELRNAESYLVLLTPASVERLWVAFETGAAWVTDRPCVLLCAGGLKRTDVRVPVGGLQLLSLDETGSEDLEAMCVRLGCPTPPNPSAFLARSAELAAVGARSAAQDDGWRFVRIGDRNYAWAGPLEHMEDRSAVTMPAELPAEFVKAFAGKRVQLKWDRPERVGTEDAQQVFVTDLKAWRRPVVSGDVVLAVAPIRRLVLRLGRPPS